jgi:uncharacterized membrane protein HdeD (DUF308 family)
MMNTMSQRMKSALSQIAPWRRDIPWWIVLIEGILTLAVGIYLVTNLQDARRTVLFIIGGYLVVTSILHIIAGLNRSMRDTNAQFTVIRGVVGLIIGLIVVLAPFFPFLHFLDTRLILAIGFLISGLIGLYGVSVVRREGGIGWAAVINSILNLALAVLLFYLTATNTTILFWIGGLAIIFGIVLVVYSSSSAVQTAQLT